MFTDQPVTPRRLEVLVEVIAKLGRKSAVRRESLVELLQPESLPDFSKRESNEPRSAAKETLKAAIALGLVEELDGGLRPSFSAASEKITSIRDTVLSALDKAVLASTEIETYLAPFYSFMLTATVEMRSSDYQEWANQYNAAVYQGVAQRNPLNKEKVRGFFRWYSYLGLGWFDPGGNFQCDPTDRLRRAIGQIFSDQASFGADDFFSRLGRTCPELDGGDQFQFANRSRSQGKVVTQGLAQALVSMHEDGVLRLHCPPDSAGWDISAASPTNDGRFLRSDRLDRIERLVREPKKQGKH